MRTVAASIVALVAGGLMTAAGLSQLSSQKGDSAGTPTPAEYERWKVELSNWGRWGKDDQLGTINLITPAKRIQAAGLVKDGFSVSLARLWERNPAKAVDITNPYEHTMRSMGSDRIAVGIHGQTTTHLDGLSHQYFDGKAYNGYAPDEAMVMKEGHAQNSVHSFMHGIFTRGILMDIPRLKGVPYLEPGMPIYVEDLEAWEKEAGVKVSAGDAIFIRTGRWAARKAIGPFYAGRSHREGRTAGLDASVLPWLKQRDVALIGSDASPFVHPAPPHLVGAVHDFSLIVLGTIGFDICDLEAVAEAAAARNRWEFLLTAAPLPLQGATGSPINPIATF